MNSSNSSKCSIVFNSSHKPFVPVFRLFTSSSLNKEVREGRIYAQLKYIAYAHFRSANPKFSPPPPPSLSFPSYIPHLTVSSVLSAILMCDTCAVRDLEMTIRQPFSVMCNFVLLAEIRAVRCGNMVADGCHYFLVSSSFPHITFSYLWFSFIIRILSKTIILLDS